MSKPIEILVLGDWVVDENWVLAKHRSSFSTMEGKAHLRALGNVNSRVMTFCGAGRVARFLYWMNRFREPTESGGEIWIPPQERVNAPPFSILGIGIWSEDDEPKLYKMFHPRYLDGINPFTLRRVKPQHIHYQQLDGLYLKNLAPAYSEAAASSPWKEVGTTRVYRLYNLQAETPGGLVLDRRVDFELRYQPVQGGRDYELTRLEELLRQIPEIPFDPERLAFATWQQHLLRDVEALKLRLDYEGGLEHFPSIRESLTTVAEDLLHAPPATNDSTGSQKPFRYVVVKDLGKGTTTLTLLEALHTVGLINRETQWFISSKQFHPTYLDTLAKKEMYGMLRLLFLPPMAIAQMEREGIAPGAQDSDHPIYKWFVGEEQPTAESLDRLEDFLGDAHSDRYPGLERQPRLVVAMPKGLSLLAVEGNGEERTGYYQPKTILDEVSEELSGRASMFFSALVSQIILSDAGVSDAIKGAAVGDAPGRTEMLEIALKAAYDVVQGNIQTLKTFGEEPGSLENREFPYDTSFGSYRRTATATVLPSRTRPSIQVLPLSWTQERDFWETSRQATGIIARDASSRRYSLELWRAMDELDGYIEVIDSRRREIARLLSALKDYLHQPSANSFSAMLIALPGSGKSFLVSKLAAALGMPHLFFNITQLVSRQNINSWFDALASAQAQERNRTHVVFFDEINSHVEGLPVYDLFLTVLEDGSYLRGGHLFKLDPCIWLFAGTTELRSTGTPEEMQKLLDSKEPDFKSRLSLDAVHLNEGGGDAQRRSMVYQGALQLQLQHPDVKKVSAQVLKAFFCLKDDTSNRKIRQLAGAFRNIRYGEVRAENLPEELRDVLKHEREHDATWELRFRQSPTDHVDLDTILVDIERQPEGAR